MSPDLIESSILLLSFWTSYECLQEARKATSQPQHGPVTTICQSRLNVVSLAREKEGEGTKTRTAAKHW